MASRPEPVHRTPTTANVRARIDAYNANRVPELVERKYEKMAKDPFVFFRGTAHLFWEDWPSAAQGLDDAPLAWSCGDLHLENFGSYRGDNRLAYFDLNDFDEGALAPATRDAARFLTSMHLAARSLQLDEEAVADLAIHYLDAYAAALVDGKARWVERSTARGMVRDLLQRVKRRSRRELLAERTTLEGGRRRLRIIPDHTFAISRREQREVAACIDVFAEASGEPEFYVVEDVVGRIAGTGSLGVPRYVVLIRGSGGARGHRILDLKEARPSALVSFASKAIAGVQPRGSDQAARVVRIQERMQAISPALLAPLPLSGAQFVLRELQPTEDRLALDKWNGRLNRLRTAVMTMGKLTAWAQLRSRSRDGSAGGDSLIGFGRDRRIRRRLIRFAVEYAAQVESDWRSFVESRS